MLNATEISNVDNIERHKRLDDTQLEEIGEVEAEELQ